MKFSQAVEIILNQEGGYIWNKDDPGGETNFGITKRNYPNLNIKELTREMAISIYLDDYWGRYRIESLPPDVRLQVFDMTVNMGPKGAATVTQRAIIAMSGVSLEIDGEIGPKTISALLQADQKALNLWIAIERKNYYIALVLSKPKMITFLRGWNRRVDDVLKKANAALQ